MSMVPLSEPQVSFTELEEILGHRFTNPTLLEEALTHSSLQYSASPSPFSFERLEFLGDAVLGLVVSNYAFSAYPHADPGQLSDIRSLNVSTEKLARVAVRHRLYRFLRRNTPVLDQKVQRFEEAVRNEEHTVLHKGSVQAPKVLADVVESIAGAIYLDVGFDLEKLWVIFRGLLEPIITLDDSLQLPPPMTMLVNLCTKMHKELKFEHSNLGSESLCNIYIDGQLFGSGSSEQKEIAKFNAAKLAIFEICKSLPPDEGLTEINGPVEIDCAKQKLQELCHKKKWPTPSYSIETEEGPAHDKVYEASVKIQAGTDVLYIVGFKKPKKRCAANSAASLMIRALQESCYLSTHPSLL